MIIGIGGKKMSGKDTTAKFFIDKGFIPTSFADPLKRYVARLYYWDLADLYCPIKKEEKLATPVSWNKHKAEVLGNLINADKPLDTKTAEFRSKREALQYIGTEVIRNYDVNFHVNETVKSLNPKNNYVIPDCRFINELNFVKDKGGFTYYVIRPSLTHQDGHASENALTATDFDATILNDGNLEQLYSKLDILYGKIKEGRIS